MHDVRSAYVGWTRMSQMLDMFERCVEGCARLDAHRESRDFGATYAAVEARLNSMQRRVDQEIDRLTSERLRADLARKQRAHAA